MCVSVLVLVSECLLVCVCLRVCVCVRALLSEREADTDSSRCEHLRCTQPPTPPLINSNISYSLWTQECGGLTLSCLYRLHSAALPAQGPPADSLRHEMLAVRACTGHVLHEQTHTGLLDSEVASIPAGPWGENTRATGMVFPVNTLVLQCRCWAEQLGVVLCLCPGARVFHGGGVACFQEKKRFVEHYRWQQEENPMEVTILWQNNLPLLYCTVRLPK